MQCCIIPEKFQETTTGVLSSNKNHFNIIQPQNFPVYHLQISSKSMTLQGYLLPSPAAPRPKAPKRTHVPPRVRRNEECNCRRSGCLLPKHHNKKVVRCGENSERSKHTTLVTETCILLRNNLSEFWSFLSIWTAKCVCWVGVARSTSRKEATPKMRFKGQVTGDVNLLDQTMTSQSKPNNPQAYHLYVMFDTLLQSHVMFSLRS